MSMGFVSVSSYNHPSAWVLSRSCLSSSVMRLRLCSSPKPSFVFLTTANVAVPPRAAVVSMASALPKGKGKGKEKKVTCVVKLVLKAGKAMPGKPVGPALGGNGVENKNIMQFCKEYNARTSNKPPGYIIPAHITIYEDKSFTFVLKTPPASVLLLKAAGVEKGSKDPKLQKVGKVTIDQLRTIATEKLPDLNCTSLESAMRIIAGTAANMGIDIDPPVLEPKIKQLV